eukprot:scaffold7033_cov257-Pinguiococcus_pyrenoidosus.AAC.12
MVDLSMRGQSACDGEITRIIVRGWRPSRNLHHGNRHAVRIRRCSPRNVRDECADIELLIQGQGGGHHAREQAASTTSLVKLEAHAALGARAQQQSRVHVRFGGAGFGRVHRGVEERRWRGDVLLQEEHHLEVVVVVCAHLAGEVHVAGHGLEVVQQHRQRGVGVEALRRGPRWALLELKIVREHLLRTERLIPHVQHADGAVEVLEFLFFQVARPAQREVHANSPPSMYNSSVVRLPSCSTTTVASYQASTWMAGATLSKISGFVDVSSSKYAAQPEKRLLGPTAKKEDGRKIIRWEVLDAKAHPCADLRAQNDSVQVHQSLSRIRHVRLKSQTFAQHATHDPAGRRVEVSYGVRVLAHVQTQLMSRPRHLHGTEGRRPRGRRRQLEGVRDVGDAALEGRARLIVKEIHMLKGARRVDGAVYVPHAGGEHPHGVAVHFEDGQQALARRVQGAAVHAGHLRTQEHGHESGAAGVRADLGRECAAGASGRHKVVREEQDRCAYGFRLDRQEHLQGILGEDPHGAREVDELEGALVGLIHLPVAPDSVAEVRTVGDLHCGVEAGVKRLVDIGAVAFLQEMPEDFAIIQRAVPHRQMTVVAANLLRIDILCRLVVLKRQRRQGKSVRREQRGARRGALEVAVHVQKHVGARVHYLPLQHHRHLQALIFAARQNLRYALPIICGVNGQLVDQIGVVEVGLQVAHRIQCHAEGRRRAELSKSKHGTNAIGQRRRSEEQGHGDVG